MKGIKRSLMVLVLCSTAASLPAFAGVGDEYHDSNGPLLDVGQFGGFYSVLNDHTDQMQFGIVDDLGRSMTIVLDKTTDRVYIADSFGRATDMAITAFGSAYAVGSAGTTFANDLRSSLLNDVGYQMIGHSYDSPYTLQLPPTVGGPCDLEPCPPIMPNTGFLGGEYTYRSQLIVFPQTWQEFYSPATIAADRTQFNRWQSDKCEQATDHYQDAALSGMGTIATCSVAETGLGAAGCVGAAATTLNSIRRGDNASRQCRQSYNGPGSWGTQ